MTWTAFAILAMFSNNISKYACFLLIFPSTTISTEQSSSQSRGTKTTIPYSIIRISGSFFMKGSVYHHNHHQFQKLTAQPSSFAPVQNVNLGGSGWTLQCLKCLDAFIAMSPYLRNCLSVFAFCFQLYFWEAHENVRLVPKTLFIVLIKVVNNIISFILTNYEY